MFCCFGAKKEYVPYSEGKTKTRTPSALESSSEFYERVSLSRSDTPKRALSSDELRSSDGAESYNQNLRK